jgi:hypothetical protein
MESRRSETGHILTVLLLLSLIVNIQRINAAGMYTQINTQIRTEIRTQVQYKTEWVTQKISGTQPVSQAAPATAHATTKATELFTTGTRLTTAVPAATSTSSSGNRTASRSNGARYPGGCTDRCTLVVDWTVTSTTIRFIMQSIQDEDSLICIGFAENKEMPADVIAGSVNSKDPPACSSEADDVPNCGSTVDAHIAAAGGALVKDESQDIVSSSVRFINRVMIMDLTLKLLRNSKDDVALNKPGGIFLIIFPKGVTSMSTPPETTVFSPQPYCFCNTQAESGSSTDTPSTQTGPDTTDVATPRKKASGFRYPKNCKDPDCIYKADYDLDDAKTISW